MRKAIATGDENAEGVVQIAARSTRSSLAAAFGPKVAERPSQPALGMSVSQLLTYSKLQLATLIHLESLRRLDRGRDLLAPPPTKKRKKARKGVVYEGFLTHPQVLQERDKQLEQKRVSKEKAEQRRKSLTVEENQGKQGRKRKRDEDNEEHENEEKEEREENEENEENENWELEAQNTAKAGDASRTEKQPNRKRKNNRNRKKRNKRHKKEKKKKNDKKRNSDGNSQQAIEKQQGGRELNEDSKREEKAQSRTACRVHSSEVKERKAPLTNKRQRRNEASVVQQSRVVNGGGGH